MKKIIIKSIAFVMLISCFFSNTVLAKEIDQNDYVEMAKIIALQYYEEIKGMLENNDLEIIKAKEIYNFDDSLRGFVFLMEDNSGNQGYINVSSLHGENRVVEASFEYYPEIFKMEDKLYYNGYFAYYVKRGVHFVDETGKEVQISEPEPNSTLYEKFNTSNVVSPHVQIQGDFYYYKLTGSMPVILQGVSGKCVPTSVAMLLSYYKAERGFTDLVSSSGTTLRDNYYNRLVSYKGTSGGFDFPDVANTLPSFVASNYSVSVSYYRSILSNYTLTDSHINTVISNISANKPVLVIVGSDGYANDSDNVIYKQKTLHALVVKAVRARYQGEGDSYLVAVDPVNGRTVDLIWNTENSIPRKYYAIYGIGLVTINRR